MDYTAYESLLYVNGTSKRERLISNAKQNELGKYQDCLSYKQVLVDGVPQTLEIISSTERFHKKISALPDEPLYAGSIIEWNDQYFLITETDTENEIHRRGDAYRCNIYLKWQNSKGEIVDCFGYSENISRFNSGVDGNKILAVAELTITVQIPCNEETIKLKRDKRFLIDLDYDSPEAFKLTGRNVITGNARPIDCKNKVFDGRDKTITLTLTLSEKSDRDNKELMIADYVPPKETIETDSYYISANKDLNLRVGGAWKTYSLLDSDGESLKTPTVWSVTTTPENEKYIKYEIENNNIKIKVSENQKIIGSQIRLDAVNGSVSRTAYIRLVSLIG